MLLSKNGVCSTCFTADDGCYGITWSSDALFVSSGARIYRFLAVSDRTPATCDVLASYGNGYGKIHQLLCHDNDLTYLERVCIPVPSEINDIRVISEVDYAHNGLQFPLSY